MAQRPRTETGALQPPRARSEGRQPAGGRCREPAQVPADPATRIVIATAHRLLGQGLEVLLPTCPSLHAVAIVSNVRELEEVARREDPDVVLVDLESQGAIEAIQTLGSGRGRVIAFNASDSPSQAVATVEAGACALVSRNSSVDDVVHAVECAVRGLFQCPANLAPLIARAGSSGDAAAGLARAEGLTRRENEVLALLAADLTNKEIAQHLFIEVSTVKNHVHRILEKLGVARRAQAARCVRRTDPVRARRSPPAQSLDRAD